MRSCSKYSESAGETRPEKEGSCLEVRCSTSSSTPTSTPASPEGSAAESGVRGREAPPKKALKRPSNPEGAALAA